MSDQPQERHVLVIEDGESPRAISLQAVAYSVGRDPSNAIVIDVETLSRQHAMLLRVPNPGKNSYNYRLVDGNAAGKASTNGVFVNGRRCTTHTLVNGDQVGFGQKVKGRYFKVGDEPNEFSSYLQSIDYQSLKAKQVNPKATMVVDETIPPVIAPAVPTAAPIAESAARDSVATAPATVVTPVTVTIPTPKPIHPLEAFLLDDEELTQIGSMPVDDAESLFPTQTLKPLKVESEITAKVDLMAVESISPMILKETLHDTEAPSPARSKLLPWLAGGVLLLTVVGTGLLLNSVSRSNPGTVPPAQQTRSAS
jgi:pSer/pThr/pTyr-binding forkhead associated (FHA) protein